MCKSVTRGKVTTRVKVVPVQKCHPCKSDTRGKVTFSVKLTQCKNDATCNADFYPDIAYI